MEKGLSSCSCPFGASELKDDVNNKTYGPSAKALTFRRSNRKHNASSITRKNCVHNSHGNVHSNRRYTVKNRRKMCSVKHVETYESNNSVVGPIQHVICSTFVKSIEYDKLLMSENSIKLDELYYAKPCIDLARDLIGKVLVRKLATGEILKGRIVETECYLGSVDKASHSYQGKQTQRNVAMFMKSGTAYVYTIYGMYYCFNISSKEEGSAVLIRALEPLEGLHTMQTMRAVRKKNLNTLIKTRDLCNGPSKLCQAMKIEKDSFNKEDLSASSALWLENGIEFDDSDIVICKRIGIGSAGEEWANKPFRFYLRGCIYVSIKDKAAEMNITTSLAQ